MAIARQDSLVEWLTRSIGWVLTSREGDSYGIVPNDHRSRCYVEVKHGKASQTVLFQAWPSLRFPLANPPHGLFGRLLLRNFDLRYASWCLSISQSCEATPSVTARIPDEALSPTLFNLICSEIVAEIDGFHQELRDRFQYDVDHVTQITPAGRAGVPTPVKGQNIVWLGD